MLNTWLSVCLFLIGKIDIGKRSEAELTVRAEENIRPTRKTRDLHITLYSRPAHVIMKINVESVKVKSKTN